MIVKLLIIEPQPLVRLGLRSAAESVGEIVVAGEAATAAEGLQLFAKEKPHVTIVNLRLPDFCAADDLDEFFAIDPDAKILVLGENAGDAEISNSLENGALGFIDGSVSAEETLRAIRTVAEGRRFIPRKVAETIGSATATENLTVAESTVLKMLVNGMSNKGIAFELDVSENTVKTHVRHIFEKLGVSDRTSATLTAIKRGLVRVDV